MKIEFPADESNSLLSDSVIWVQLQQHLYSFISLDTSLRSFALSVSVTPWDQLAIFQKIKIAVYKVAGRNSLLHGGETWPLYRKLPKHFECFIKESRPWSPATGPGLWNWDWDGFMIRKDDTRLPKSVLFFELAMPNETQTINNSLKAL